MYTNKSHIKGREWHKIFDVKCFPLSLNIGFSFYYHLKNVYVADFCMIKCVKRLYAGCKLVAGALTVVLMYYKRIKRIEMQHRWDLISGI